MRWARVGLGRASSSSPYPMLDRPSPRSNAQAYAGWRPVPNTMTWECARVAGVGAYPRIATAIGPGFRPSDRRTTECAPSAPTST